MPIKIRRQTSWLRQFTKIIAERGYFSIRATPGWLRLTSDDVVVLETSDARIAITLLGFNTQIELWMSWVQPRWLGTSRLVIESRQTACNFQRSEEWSVQVDGNNEAIVKAGTYPPIQETSSFPLAKSTSLAELAAATARVVATSEQ